MPPEPHEHLSEGCACTHFWGLTDNRNGYSLDLPEDDFVAQYREWREQCPDAKNPGHPAFCQRCDNSFPSSIGGADWLRKKGWKEINPLEKFPEPLKPREGPKVSPALWESLALFIQRVPLAPGKSGAKIKELTELTVPEKDLMADNEATRQLFRELLGMTGGANASGRGTMHIPDDIMDSLSGDAAQEELARNSLIMEMRRQEGRRRDPAYVSLDLMEMEADHVDEFLKNARKKIIKRSKPTRKVCCSRIGGVLDQMLGLGSSNYGFDVQPTDRGKFDPIGDADQVERTYKVVKESVDVHHYTFPDLDSAKAFHSGVMKHKNPNQMKGDRSGVLGAQAGPIISKKPYVPVTFGEGGVESHGETVAALAKEHGGKRRQQDNVDVDLLNFIAEEFFHYEHSDGCAFADPKFSLDENEQRFFRPTKRPGLLREHFNLTEGAGLSMDKAKKALAILKQRKAAGQLAGKEAALLPRLEQYVKMMSKGKEEEGGDAKDQQEEDYNMEPSRTASALSSFMESSHAVDRYKAASAGNGKGSPDKLDYSHPAGQLSLRTRDDNAEYDTELMAAKSGGKRTAGQPQSLSTRDRDRGDPIGEDDQLERSYKVVRTEAAGWDPTDPRSKHKGWDKRDPWSQARAAGVKIDNESVATAIENARRAGLHSLADEMRQHFSREVAREQGGSRYYPNPNPSTYGTTSGKTKTDYWTGESRPSGSPKTQNAHERSRKRFYRTSDENKDKRVAQVGRMEFRDETDERDRKRQKDWDEKERLSAKARKERFDYLDDPAVATGKHAARKGRLKDDVDYDGPQIGEAEGTPRFIDPESRVAYPGAAQDERVDASTAKKAHAYARRFGLKVKNPFWGGGTLIDKEGRQVDPSKLPKPVRKHIKFRAPMDDDVDYDGPQISETASALANFMEANEQAAVAREKLALRSKPSGDLDLNKRPNQTLGGPLAPAKGVRAKIGKPRWDADPEGDANDKGAGKN